MFVKKGISFNKISCCFTSSLRTLGCFYIYATSILHRYFYKRGIKASKREIKLNQTFAISMQNGILQPIVLTTENPFKDFQGQKNLVKS